MSDQTKYQGLTAAEVEQSRLQHGNNILTPVEKTPWWRKALAKFYDPLIIILLIAGALSIGISFYEYYGLDAGPGVFFEPIGIILAIILATGLAVYFEQKAEGEFAILNRVNDDQLVQVIRGGNITQVPRKDVVVGDIVILNTGDEIPADGTLLEATSLNVDESTLTGEPMAHKTVVEADFDPEATFASNEVKRGTKVMEGHGIMKVTAVGDHTENGKVFKASQIDNSVKTPLDIQLSRLGKLISRASYAFALLIVAGRIFMYFSSCEFEVVHFVTYMLQTLMIAVTLIVVAVPEGLPMAVTLALAYSMRRMLKTNNLVRKMHACETMGATTVICTDKTGTLTQNQMQVAAMQVVNPQGELAPLTDAHNALLCEGIAVNSTAQLDFSDPDKPTPLGNPTEGALLLWLWKQQVDYRTLRNQAKIIAEIPFTTERKYMATLVQNPTGEKFIFVKGAPEIVYGLCGDSKPGKAEFDSKLLEYQNQAMRTLGFAYCPTKLNNLDDDAEWQKELDFQAVAAISDPVRKEVPQAVNEVLDAGIEVKIVTGDTTATAREIGRQIGLWRSGDTDNAIITGPEFEKLSDQELLDNIDKIKIIARARPMDKKRLVETLQQKGQVVAVTGDGTNDAPALKAAHVGLSMGDGTSVAKEASDITIVDNSFKSIGRAVMWGRSLYRNIQRFILFQLTVNVVACFIVLAGSFMGMDSPLTVTQMLWVNLIMDTFAAMALASLPPDSAVMHDAPRSREAFIITRGMWQSIIITGTIFFFILLGLLWYFEHTDLQSLTQMWQVPFSQVNSGLTPYELSLFFTIFVMLQFWNLFNARAYLTGHSAFSLQGCGEFEFVALIILVGQIFIVQIGGKFFNVVPLQVIDWLIIIAGTSPVLWIGEGLRRLKKKK